jgi:MoaA/NifB/PqqE/SkfB family radical SAM enzyme
LTPDLARRIVGEELLKGIHFSLHGLKETHEGITRVKNSFDRTLKGIEYILTERTKRGLNRPEVTIACTIIGTNMKEVKGLAKLMEEIKVDRLSFGHASFMTPDIQHRHQKVMEQLELPVESSYDDLVQGSPKIPVAQEDLEGYIQFLSRIRHSPLRSKIRTSPEGYRGEDIRRHFLDMNWKFKASCTYPWRNLRIGPDGTVTPCVGILSAMSGIRISNKFGTDSAFASSGRPYTDRSSFRAACAAAN